ncbi:uncharacterized protein LOC134839180 isoform X3 [Symsagittifera roscoffensis]|uniref:uncharacterized protein LOC134839180 isoform X3 n=1 Tax=Symsagittifera roscoffensis TaxID=84072 RepID=UPI00307C4282
MNIFRSNEVSDTSRKALSWLSTGVRFESPTHANLNPKGPPITTSDNNSLIGLGQALTDSEIRTRLLNRDSISPSEELKKAEKVDYRRNIATDSNYHLYKSRLPKNPQKQPFNFTPLHVKEYGENYLPNFPENSNIKFSSQEWRNNKEGLKLNCDSPGKLRKISANSAITNQTSLNLHQRAVKSGIISSKTANCSRSSVNNNCDFSSNSKISQSEFPPSFKLSADATYLSRTASSQIKEAKESNIGSAVASIIEKGNGGKVARDQISNSVLSSRPLRTFSTSATNSQSERSLKPAPRLSSRIKHKSNLPPDTTEPISTYSNSSEATLKGDILAEIALNRTKRSSFQAISDYKSDGNFAPSAFIDPKSSETNLSELFHLTSDFNPIRLSEEGSKFQNHTFRSSRVELPLQPRRDSFVSNSIKVSNYTSLKSHFANYINPDCISSCIGNEILKVPAAFPDMLQAETNLSNMTNSTIVDPEALAIAQAQAELRMQILAFEQIFSTVVGILGLIGALLVILVYNFRHKATPSEKIITALSSIDFCYNLNAIIILTMGKYVITDREGTAYFVLRCMNYFLFGFVVITSFLLIQLITVNRFYAICRPTDYKTTFNKERVRLILIAIFGGSFLQGLTNASYAFFEDVKIAQKIIDIEYIGMMDLNVSAAAALMCLVYVKVLLKFAKQRKRMSMHAHGARTATQERVRKANAIPQSPDKKGEKKLESESRTLLSVPLSSAPAASSSESNQISVVASAAHEKRVVAASPSTPRTQSQKRPKSSSSDRVTFTLFIISIAFMFCVCPFVVDYNYKTLTNPEKPNQWVSFFIRLLFQINFLSNPVIYFSTSKIFRGRTFELIGYVSPKLEKYIRTTKLFKNCLPPEDANPKQITNATAARSYANTEKTTF